MRSPRRGAPVLIALTLAALAVAAAPAAADRKPTEREARGIERVSIDRCGSPPGGCTYHGARVSTPNARFAWGDVTGEGFSGALVKRRTRSSRRWRVVGWQGGGIGTCAYWRKRAPRGVLRDLRIAGLVDDRGTVKNCG